MCEKCHGDSIGSDRRVVAEVDKRGRMGQRALLPRFEIPCGEAVERIAPEFKAVRPDYARGASNFAAGVSALSAKLSSMPVPFVREWADAIHAGGEALLRLLKGPRGEAVVNAMKADAATMLRNMEAESVEDLEIPEGMPRELVELMKRIKAAEGGPARGADNNELMASLRSVRDHLTVEEAVKSYEVVNGIQRAVSREIIGAAERIQKLIEDRCAELDAAGEVDVQALGILPFRLPEVGPHRVN